MRLAISDEDQAAYFFCAFCETEYKWPFGARIHRPPDRAPALDDVHPDPRHVIMTHHIGSLQTEKFGFPRCPKMGAWQNTGWEVMDRDHDVRLAVGRIIVEEDGYPYVTAPISATVVCRACRKSSAIESVGDLTELARVFTRDGFVGRPDGSAYLWCGECSREYRELAASGAFASPDLFEADKQAEREVS